LPPQSSGVGATGTAAPGSPGTASTAWAQKTGQAPHGAHAQLTRRTGHSGEAVWRLPTGLPKFDAAMRLWCGFLRATRGCLAACVGPTLPVAPLQSAETDLGGACHSSDCWPHPLADRPHSSTSASFGTTSTQMAGCTSGIPTSLPHAQLHIRVCE
jgi:hypothetical protein